MPEQHSGYDLFHAIHDMCLEAEPIVRFPPDVPVHVCELMATLGVTVEADASMGHWKRGGLSEHGKPRFP